MSTDIYCPNCHGWMRLTVPVEEQRHVVCLHCYSALTLMTGNRVLVATPDESSRAHARLGWADHVPSTAGPDPLLPGWARAIGLAMVVALVLILAHLVILHRAGVPLWP